MHDTIHARISEEGGYFVASCQELFVVSQGPSVSETVKNLQEALRLYFEDEDPEALGFVSNPRLILTFETNLLAHVA
jgi:predicted RNase H-like HicB family nuclease